MAATLPAITNGLNRISLQSPIIQQHRVPSPPTKSPVITPRVLNPLRKSQGKKERELALRQQALRSQQPDLSKRDTAKYRNSYKHNLCLDMLQDGFHQSFAELFALIKRQAEDRLRAGPESLLWNQTMLENEPEKLETLKLYLTQSETALRNENYAEVYNAHYQLAMYFQQTGDKWLSDHFFMSCLATSANMKGTDGRKAAEGHCNVGLALEESGDYFDAAKNFEAFHQLTAEKTDWVDSEDTALHTIACNHLTRIYTTIGYQFDRQNDMPQSLEYLAKAFNMAKEGGNRQLEGESSYRLGQGYEKNGDSETALLYLDGYLDICKSLDDNAGIGQACEAISKSYESQNKIEESIKYLEMFIEVAERSKDDKAISKAASNLGGIFNSLGKYEQAVDYFNKAYNISRSMNDTESISSSRVLYGVAAAHKMMEHVVKHVDVATRPCLERIVEWKDNRGDEFEKPIPEPVKEPEPEPKKVEAEQPAEEKVEPEGEEQSEEKTEATQETTVEKTEENAE